MVGGMRATEFLRKHWQKQPLLTLGAIPEAGHIIALPPLKRLAARDDVESRLVIRDRNKWNLKHGPFTRGDYRSLPETGWTLLVQGVNMYVDAADALLHRFNFLPYARLDDVMVSYAAPGGGVGPHFDSYDVFLVQGTGRRRWRISTQDDLALRKDLPVKILRRFRAEREWILDTGDMLYLPPRCAHDGVAVEACMTYSIGFRTPTAQALGQALLEHLLDTLNLDAVYSDPDLKSPETPGKITESFQRRCASLVKDIRWNASTVEMVLGQYLTEPKANVFFSPPGPELERSSFTQRAKRFGLRLDRRTRLLYDGRQVFVNGQAVAQPASAKALRMLADARVLSGHGYATSSPAERLLFYDWYRHGFIHIAS